MALVEKAPLSWDPYDVDMVTDPYPVYRRLREEAPLYYNEEYDFYAVSRFDDVERGLMDHGTSSPVGAGSSSSSRPTSRCRRAS